MSGAVDRNRGAATERLAVAGLRTLGFPHAERTVRTGYRNATRELADAGDIDGTPGLVWQIKSLRPPTRAEAAVPEWLTETEQQRVAAGATLGILVVRRDHRLAPEWWAFVPVVDLYGLADGMSGTLRPPAYADADRDTLVRYAARLELAHLCTLLRGYGFGEPLEAS